MKGLTEEQFINAIKHLEMSADSIKIARQVLVEGKSQVSVAKQHGITKGRVWQIVERVREAHASKSVPVGYQRITVVLPDALAVKVREWSYKSNN